MKQNSSSQTSETDWDRIAAMTDEEIDFSDLPELTEEQIKSAELRLGGKPIARGKVRVNIYLDAAVVAYYKSMAGGKGYQTLINETLRQSIQGSDLEAMLRRIIREELSLTQ
jgi:uncharacterized protein (DUF4415 family)